MSKYELYIEFMKDFEGLLNYSRCFYDENVESSDKLKEVDTRILHPDKDFRDKLDAIHWETINVIDMLSYEKVSEVTKLYIDELEVESEYVNIDTMGTLLNYLRELRFDYLHSLKKHVTTTMMINNAVKICNNQKHKESVGEHNSRMLESFHSNNREEVYQSYVRNVYEFEKMIRTPAEKITLPENFFFVDKLSEEEKEAEIKRFLDSFNK